MAVGHHEEQLLPALFPLVIGLLAAFVAYGRSRLAPLSASSAPAGLTRPRPAGA